MKNKRAGSQEIWQLPHCSVCGYDIHAGDLIVKASPYQVRHATALEAQGQRIKYGIPCAPKPKPKPKPTTPTHSEALAECAREGLAIE